MEGTAESQTPDLRDVEGKVGRKTPEGLLRGLRGEGEPGTSGAPLLPGAPGAGHGLGDKIMALRMELVYLRAIDVKILQQLLSLNEGIEAVRWLLEERGTLTSHCSSLTSSQYSLTGGSPGHSRRGSWDSLPDTSSMDRLDSLSIGSFLDTVAPSELDEQGPPGAPRPETDWAKVIPSGDRARTEVDPTASRLGSLRAVWKPPGEGLHGGPPEPLEDEGAKLGFEAHWYWGQCQDDVTFL
ncbi:leucine rich adaptor protein 1 [Lycaon pictus]|uniref:Leucine rich adaptor protein 1 n=2 Tax=Canis lupus TaxID=9612 RepID=A0A8C0ST21_CANLF|nr:leucine rich adaptor protein 1 [Canis lupus dingo]XP_038414109.1 leucine rich adaptor protein 1 [Canis lupus familiaris]XP_048950389.1 leucine rich adaptor protein 1 [Canis lupus dingo]XP_532593.2 leucine rich adaptor protein 1 [Canis lupus familiaris]|eukprot:XP_532593.2 leucine rich adaptor protein 1 [Canis lupus familiaris]